MSTIAFIGTGQMGSRMAVRLLAAAHTIRVSDPSTSAVAALVEHGAVAASCPAEACEDAQYVLCSLPGPAVLREVVLGSRGVLAAANPPKYLIDFSTVGPAVARELASAVGEHGLRYIDAPVSGGVVGAAAGTLVTMVGASAENLDAVRAVLDVLTEKIVHCGDPGDGQMMKLSHNMLAAINTVAAGEVLTAAVKSGIDLEVLTEVFGGGLAGSKMLDYFARTLFTEERPANFALDMMHKDIALCLSEVSDLVMPLSHLVLQSYNAARTCGLGSNDSTSVVELYERLYGLRLVTSETIGK
jgi:3-hydroxyisobutyrate dehydrogenase